MKPKTFTLKTRTFTLKPKTFTLKPKTFTFKTAWIALVLAASTPALAETPRVVAGFKHPESVLIVGARRFVSNIGEKFDPLAKDGDGFISELDGEGRVVALKAFPADGAKLDAPKGMASLGGRLYVADIDRIVGFDLTSRKQVFEARAPEGGATFLNDLTTMEGALVVTDTFRGLVSRVDVTSGVFTTLASAVPGANGVVWDGARKRLLVVGSGAKFEGGDLFEIDMTRPDAPTLKKLEKGPHGVLDGLALLADGRILVSDWVAFDPPRPGVALVLAPDGGSAKPLDFGRPLIGPADFALDAEKGEIWMPAMADGVVVIAAAPK